MVFIAFHWKENSLRFCKDLRTSERIEIIANRIALVEYVLQKVFQMLVTTVKKQFTTSNSNINHVLKNFSNYSNYVNLSSEQSIIARDFMNYIGIC